MLLDSSWTISYSQPTLHTLLRVIIVLGTPESAMDGLSFASYSFPTQPFCVLCSKSFSTVIHLVWSVVSLSHFFQSSSARSMFASWPMQGFKLL
jgi:hypothetical protein